MVGDVRRIGIDIKNNYSQIDVLIHNAGLRGFYQRITREGFSEMIAVNYLTPRLLTNMLLDKIGDPRRGTEIIVPSYL